MDTFSCNSYEQKHTPLNHHGHDYDHHDGDDHDQEESGWTTYLEDFSNQYRTDHDDDHEGRDHRDKSSCSLLGVSPSLVSDAATEAFSGKSFPAKLKFGRGRKKKFCEDDSLEDTASSPVNSPKGNIRDMEDHNQIQVKEGDEQKMKMISNLREGNINNNNYNRDLRSRGLCVVLMSMLANFKRNF
ncbi:unnamed protein product [Cochlearia groenlandica]